MPRPLKKNTDRDESPVDEGRNTPSPGTAGFAMSEQQFSTLLQSITSSNVEMNRMMMETLLHKTEPDTAASPVHPPTCGSFVKCTARFDGTSRNADELEAFIDAIEIYKECANVSDAHALRGLPMILVGEAAVWWRGVRSTVLTWPEAIRRLRAMYGVPRPAYKIFRDIYSAEQGADRADVFVSRVRALLSKLPYVVPEIMKLDIVYGLLDRRIRKRVARDEVHNLEHMIEKVRLVEEALMEVSNPLNPVSIKPLSASVMDPFNPDGANVIFPPAGVFSHLNTTAVNPVTAATVSPLSTIAANLSQRPLNTRMSTGINASEKFNSKRTRPKCTYCKLFGHSIDECRSKSNKPSKSDGRVVNKVGSTELRCYGCGQLGVVKSKCEICRGQSPATTPGTNRADFHSAHVEGNDNARTTVEVEIVGHKGVAILDTGATHSIASPMLYQLLERKGVEFRTTHRTVGLADGSQQVREALECDTIVNLQSRAIPTSFLVFPEADTRTLLGRDFIIEANLVLDLPQETWNFSNEPQMRFPFLKSYDLSSSGDAELMRVDAVDLTLRNEEGTKLTREQRVQLNALLVRRADRFTTEGPPTEYAIHHIKVSDRQQPIASPPYRLAQNKKDVLEVELTKLLETDVIEECESPWAANVVLVTKKDGGVRLCVDYRKLNAVTEPDRYPLPRMEDILHAAKTTNFMTTCDLRSGYFQVSVATEDRDKTAFVTPLGTYRFKRMPMGLRNSGATFQRLMDRFKAGKGLSDVSLLAYLDDIIILSETFEKHLRDLEAVFDRLEMFNLRINREKSFFARESVKFLGHVIVPGGIQADPEKTAAIANMAIPHNVKHLKSFLQTSSWFRRFIPNYAEVAKPLTDLLKKDCVWMWTPRQQEAFDNIRQLLVSPPILRQADETKPFILRTDSSGYCLGAVLMQGEKQDERPVEYASRLLISAERNYTTTEREALAVVWAVNKFRGYIEGSEVVVKSDHQPLRWLMSIKSPSGRLARWALTLQEYNLKIEYTPGRSNAIADTLSRPPCSEEPKWDLCYAEVDLPSRSPRDVRENQLKDPDLLKIITDLEDSNEPFRGRSWADRGFTMSDGILYRYGPEHDDEETACLVIPSHEREKVLSEYHDAPTAGHFGVERTLHRLSSKFYWPGMRQYVADYIKKCVPCQRYKVDIRKPAGLLQTPATTRRFEVVAVDLFGPLPETPGKNKWILIVEDVCTRWVELFALQSATSADCAKTLIVEVFLRYGVPRRILSDNGVQFISEVMQQVCHTFGITQSLTPRYHPEANPVERKNRDLKPQLAILVKQDHSSWDTHLAAIRFAMNSAVTSSTGHSPAYLTFGREIRAPADVLSDMRVIVDSDNAVTSITSYLQKLSTTLLEARDVHEKAQKTQKRYADLKRQPAPEYVPGDLVLLKTQGPNDTGKGQTPKFIPRRDGPYRIREATSTTTYHLERVSSGELLGRYHVSQLTPFVGDVQPPVNEKRRRGRPRKVLQPVHGDVTSGL